MTYHEPPEAYRRRRLLTIAQRAADRLHRREARIGYGARATEQALHLLHRIYRAAGQD